MTKKEQKEYEDLKVLQELASKYSIRRRVLLHEKEELDREYEWLVKKINKMIAKAEKEQKKDECNIPDTDSEGTQA